MPKSRVRKVKGKSVERVTGKTLCEAGTPEALASLQLWAKNLETIKSVRHAASFINALATDYEYDRKMMCEAIVHSMLAGAMAFTKKLKLDDITEAEINLVMWGFIEKWTGFHEPLKLVRMSYMLNPDAAYMFANTIPKSYFDWLQHSAEDCLKDLPDAPEGRRAFWQSIVEGTVPFGYKVEETIGQENDQGTVGKSIEQEQDLAGTGDCMCHE